MVATWAERVPQHRFQVMHEEKLDCEGPDGRTEFLLTIDDGFPILVCRVRNIPYPEDHKCFELSLKPLGGGVFQVVWIEAQVDRYRRKGIPDALLPRMCELLKGRIRSSPADGGRDAPDQWRLPEASKMWDRLVEKGLASYDKDADVYRTPPQED